ncbi:hypothetical protein GCK32_010638 [Trichostrongylus colubriformis]|uniref:Uncharacterized protein n=1 Tax=Trichostrongylus colubriformis TaxID=6319 RepID=A0AAN8IIY2_TRICO
MVKKSCSFRGTWSNVLAIMFTLQNEISPSSATLGWRWRSKPRTGKIVVIGYGNSCQSAAKGALYWGVSKTVARKIGRVSMSSRIVQGYE